MINVEKSSAANDFFFVICWVLAIADSLHYYVLCKHKILDGRQSCFAVAFFIDFSFAMQMTWALMPLSILYSNEEHLQIQEVYDEAGVWGFWKGVFPTLIMVREKWLLYVLRDITDSSCY